jgi:hypothetical protein
LNVLILSAVGEAVAFTINVEKKIKHFIHSAVSAGLFN